MSSDWKTMRIESSPIEIIDGDRGVNYPKLEEFFEDDYCLFLNTSNVTKQGFNFSKTQFITKEKDSLLGKGKLKQFDIVLTTRGTVGNIAYFDEKIPYKNIRINSGMVIFRNNNVNVVSTKYFYQFLKSNLFRDQVISFSSGSAQPQLPIGDLKQIEFPIPPLSIQNRIAEILSSLDDKIELNRQTNATLEAIAQAIFKEWFVDFNYPGATGEMVESELGLIPKGWRIVQLGEIADLSWGDTKTTKNSYVNEGYIAYSASGPDGFLPYYDFSRDGVVVSAIGAYSGKTWFAHDKWSCIKNTIRFWSIDQDISNEYLFLQTSSRGFWPLRGSAQPFISQTDARNKKILYPKDHLASQFGFLTCPFFSTIFHNLMENNILSKVRDSLIPGLMDGTIDL